MRRHTKINKYSGATLIEIIIIIVVIGILATFTALKFESWQQSSYISSIKSDLYNIVSAMENARNFDSTGLGYPELATSVFKPSNGVAISGGSSDGGKTYCVDATSIYDGSIDYYIDSDSADKGPRAGTCAGRDGSMPVPSGLIAYTSSTNSISISWNLVASADGYNLQKSTNASFTDAITIASFASNPTLPYESTGLSTSSQYYFRIQSKKADKVSVWSESVNARTSNITISVISPPVVSQNSNASTTTYSWSNDNCSAGLSIRYQYKYAINPSGYDSGWKFYNGASSMTMTTSTGGQNYRLAIRAQCYDVNAVSEWSSPGQASFYRPGTWKQIVVGGSHSCGIASNGGAYCWGDNTYGQLGDGSNVMHPIPTSVNTSGVLSGLTVKSISANMFNTCVIASDDNAYCWGRNNYGQIGDNTSGTDRNVPTAVYNTGLLNGLTLKSISVGQYHTCAVASDNNAYCWGENDFSQIGDYGFTTRLVPTAVYKLGALSGLSIKSISSGAYHSCVVASDDNAYCWGWNVYGQLGDNSTDTRMSPTAVYKSGALNGLTVKEIFAAVGTMGNTCAIASDNNAYCWGNNDNGQIGDNTSGTNRTVPTAVLTAGVLNGLTISSIAPGAGKTCAIASDDNAYCWGSMTIVSGEYHDAGDFYNASTSLVPVAVYRSSRLNGLTIKNISESGDHGCLVASNLNGYCWGNNSQRQLGNDYYLNENYIASPFPVNAPY